MIGPAGFMAGPKAQEIAKPTERWAVSSFSRRGIAHWWRDAPINPRYVRSHCGIVEDKGNLKSLDHDSQRCRVCDKAFQKEKS